MNEQELRINEAIADKECRQADIAGLYRELIEQGNGTVDWPRINRLIIDRWSIAGLKKIKRLAWL